MAHGSPLRWVSLESRRSGDLAGLLERAGFAAIEAPSMQEVENADQTEARLFADRLIAADYDLLVLLTGVGFRRLLAVAHTAYSPEAVRAALRKRPIACRGPKPVAVLKELGLRPTLTAPEPNTYRELLAALAGWRPLSGQRLVLQEYGLRNLPLAQALREQGAEVTSVSIYAWALPDDLKPLRRAVTMLCAGEADGVILTSQQQLQHLFEVAQQERAVEALQRALLERCLIASIGPITSEALRARGLVPDLEPEHPKMGHLVKCLKTDAQRLLQAKRSRLG